MNTEVRDGAVESPSRAGRSGESPTASQRVLLVLEAFTEGHAWGVRELAKHLDLSKSSVHRTLQDMADDGFLDPLESGDYAASPSLLRLGMRLSQSFEIARVAEYHLGAARDECGETVILTVYEPRRRQFSAVVAAESSHAVRYIWQALRGCSDLHLGASGKSILAFLDPVEQDEILSALDDPIPGPRPRSRRSLINDLRRTRRRGWASSVGERYLGARGVAAPIRDRDGTIIGAVVIGMPDRPGAADWEIRLGELSARTAAAISSSLGGQSAP